jgi:hypothetical protein
VAVCGSKKALSGAPRGKPYVEAFPALSLTAARRAWAKGPRFVEWRSEEGVVVGHVEVVGISDTAFTFLHRFFGTPNVEKDSGSNELVVRSRKVNPDRIAHEIVCPINGQRVDKIYFVRGKWGCRVCHDLTYIVKRISPAHKTIVQTDALSTKLDCTPLEQRRTRDYYNARRKLERLQRETADAPSIPKELLFRAVERWLEPGELPKSSIDPDEKGYGWVPGERRGLKAFFAPEPPPPEPGAQLWLTRFSRALPLLGLKLFTGNLMSLLTEHVPDAVSAAAQVLAVRDLSRGELAAVIAEAMTIQKVELESANLHIQNRVDDEHRLHISATLAYSGGSRLLRVKARGSTVSPLLRATFNETSITFATFCPDSERAKAEQVVRLGVRRLEEQLLEQAKVLDQYGASLAENAEALATVMLHNLARGKQPGEINIKFRR